MIKYTQMDLWTNIESNDANKDVWAQISGKGLRKRARRPNEREILATLRHWLLHDYVAAYCRVLAATRIFRRCYWVDALGLNAREQTLISLPESAENGNGAKKRRKKEPDVSMVPQALLPISLLGRELVQEQPPFSLYGLLLSGSRQNAHVAQEALPQDGGVLRSNWLDGGPALLRELEPSPAIFLLNPFAPSLFGNDDLLKIYQRTAPTELLLWLPHQAIDACLHAARSDEQVGLKLTNLLRTDRWKTLPSAEAERAQAINGFLKLFILSMKRYFSLPIQRLALPVQVGPAWMEHVPSTLLFATRRQDSFQHMNEALCNYRRRLYALVHEGVLAEEWFLIQEQERHAVSLDQLTQRIIQLGRGQRVRRWPDLRQQAMLEYFGQFTLNDYDGVMQHLLQSGEVRCEWRRARPTSEDPVLPGNDDLLVWR